MTVPPKKKAPAKPKAKPKPKAKTKAKATTPRKPTAKKPAAKKAAAKKPAPKKADSPNKRAPRTYWKWARRTAKYAALLALLFVGVTVLWVGTLRWVNPPITGLMLTRHFSEAQPIDKVWRDYGDIAPDLLVAVLAAEDQRFYTHNGFDMTEIRNALETRAEGGAMRGASTLTQQTAKNVFLWPARSWWRKGAEVYFTVLIEVLWPKRRILEVYVNVAEMGPGIYGVESASQHYFGVSADALSREQAAMLAGILPSPLTRDPRSPTEAMQSRQAWILKQMHNLGGARYLE